MANAREPLRPMRGALERLTARIPGFRGYLERSERRAADKLVREHGAERLERVARELGEVTARAASEELGEHQELVTQLEKLRAELRFADRGYCAFFDEPGLDAGSGLDSVYAQDERVFEQVDEIAAQVTGPDFSAGKLRGSVKRLGFALADRRNAILRLRSR